MPKTIHSERSFTAQEEHNIQEMADFLEDMFTLKITDIVFKNEKAIYMNNDDIVFSLPEAEAI